MFDLYVLNAATMLAATLLFNMFTCESVNIKINCMIYIASFKVFPGEKDLFISVNAFHWVWVYIRAHNYLKRHPKGLSYQHILQTHSLF